MLNQNSSNLAGPSSTNLSKLSDQELQIFKPLCHFRDVYLENFRSHKRHLFLEKKRLGYLEDQKDTLGQGLSIIEFISKCLKQTYTLEQMNELVISLNSANRYRQHFGVIGIRKLLSRDEDSPIQLFIDAGIIPRLIEFLGKGDEMQLQMEAAWTLSNMASGTPEQVKQVVDNGAVPELIKLLGCRRKHIQEQAMWALANIAAENTNFRDAVRKEGAMRPLIKIVEEALSKGDIEMIKKGNWALSNLCRKTPLPPYEEVKEAFPTFAKIIMTELHTDVLSDALWSLANLSDGEYGEIQPVYDSGVVPYIVRQLDCPYACVKVPCLKIIRNICSGHEYIDMLLGTSDKIMEKLFRALNHEKKAVRREGARALSHISAGDHKHKELMVGNVVYLTRLFSIGINDVLEMRREVAWLFKNLMTDPEQMKILLEKNILEYLVKLLEEEDDDLQEIGFEGIGSILKFEGDQACEQLSKNKMAELKNHSDPRISKLACDILGDEDNTGDNGEV